MSDKVELLATVHGATHQILALQELLNGVLDHDSILASAARSYKVKPERVIRQIRMDVEEQIKILRRLRRKARAELE